MRSSIVERPTAGGAKGELGLSTGEQLQDSKGYSVYTKADMQFVQPLLKKLRSFQNNSRCLYPGCERRPIGSHVIARSALELLADEEGKVLTWEATDNSIVENTIQGHEWGRVYQQPRRVGIRQEVTYPIFCQEHDNGIFAELENTDFTFHPMQVALLAYRALCYKTWNPHLEEMLEFYLSNKDAETALQLQRIFSLRTLIETRQKLENILETRDYRQLQWVTMVLHIDPCFACTDAVISYHGIEDARNIANGSTTLMPDDVMTFSFFPDKNLNASICVVTWCRGNERASSFLENLDLDSSSEDDIRQNIIHTALRVALVYASPMWWNTLSPELQAHTSELQMSHITSLQDL